MSFDDKASVDPQMQLAIARPPLGFWRVWFPISRS
jgi:hypothetical protein